MSNISKVAKTKMEITADYQKLSDLNVAFYNQDINTSILQFNVTRNDAPVPLGKTNVDGYIVLLHEDGSRIQDNLVIVNEEHGVIQYTIPREFLKHTGKVLGQVYIAVKGRDDTAVMRKITFDIKQDLMTAFSAAVKLEYIKTFDDLQTKIKQRVEDIEEAIANGEDYVAQMIATLDTGKKEIAATVAKANTDINKVANDAKNNVTVTADTATKAIDSTVTKATTDIAKTVSDGQKKITDTSNTAVATVDAKAKEVTDAIKDNQVVKITETANWQKAKLSNDDGTSLSVPPAIKDWLLITDSGNYAINTDSVPENRPPSGTYFSLTVLIRDSRSRVLLAYDIEKTNSFIRTMVGGKWRAWEQFGIDKEAKNYQKLKITNDDGSSITLRDYDLLNTTDVSNFDGYVTTASNAPSTNNTGYFKRKYRSSYIEITFSPHSTKDVYRNSYNNWIKSWVGWEKMVTSSELASVIGSNTGWLPLPLLNGVTASTPCFYRFYSTNGIYYLSFKGTLNTLSTRDVIIAKLPAEVATKIDRALTWVGNTSVSSNTARFNRWIVEVDGTIKFTASNFGTDGESGAWNPLDVTLTL